RRGDAAWQADTRSVQRAEDERSDGRHGTGRLLPVPRHVRRAHHHRPLPGPRGQPRARGGGAGRSGRPSPTDARGIARSGVRAPGGLAGECAYAHGGPGRSAGAATGGVSGAELMVTIPPLVSVVTPVYNGERHLVECIESVLAQTYERWEHTIVDNCSTDRTREIAERYAKKDARIRVHPNSTFVDLLPNHNIAFRQISPAAAYCKVVQADDWIFPECLERMVAVAEAHPTVGVVGAYRLDGAKVDCDGLPYPSTLVP